jgi:hypothetical protein
MSTVYLYITQYTFSLQCKWNCGDEMTQRFPICVLNLAILVGQSEDGSISGAPARGPLSAQAHERVYVGGGNDYTRRSYLSQNIGSLSQPEY